MSAVDSGVTTGYRYNADGQRTVRTVGSVNTWYIYGMGGELVAEYPANGVTSTPQMEYGYRNGQMLIEGGCDVVRWLVADHLGTPRMSVDITGTPANMKRHDYLPFGEEIGAGIGVRTAAQGYSADCLRQKFTGYERDTETGLDFAQARYFSNVQGRFTSPDLPFADQVTHDPQSWNLYSYVRNNPINFIDPDGRSTHTNKDGVVVAVYDDDNLDVYKHDNLGKWNGKSTLASKGKGITNMGATEYINEFAAIDSNGSYLKNKDGSFVVAKNATIKFGDSFDGDISRLNADAQKMSLRNVANNSTNGLKFDIKVDKSIAPNGEYTGKLLNGKYASARSAGNYLAGLNGATSTQGGFYIDYVIYANMAGALQTGQWEGAATTFRRIMIEKKTYGPPPYYGEQEYSGRRIRAGLSHGVCVRNNRLGC